MTEPIRVTDAKETKQLPCRVCGAMLIVNKFESARRAACPEHRGKPARAFRVPRAEDREANENREPNTALGVLHCPACNEPMVLIRVEEETMSFKCRECSGLWEYTPNMAHLIIPRAPAPLIPLITAINESRLERMYESDRPGRDR